MIIHVFRSFISTSFRSAPLRSTLLLIATMLFVVLLFTNGQVRTISAVLFCLLVPGSGWARRLPGNSRGDTLALAVILSICATILLGTIMVILHTWVPINAFLILTAIGIAGFLPLRQPPPVQGHDDGSAR